MTADLTGLCRAHSFETAQDVCRRCGTEYCELCLVFPLGPSKPLCKECAMAAGGVRSHVGRPAMAKKDLKRKVKAFNQRREAQRENAGAAAGLDVNDPILNDPLAPTSDDLERMPEPAAPTADDGAAVAAELAAEFASTPSNAPTPADGSEPADGVAPPIDWSQPFG